MFDKICKTHIYADSSNAFQLTEPSQPGDYGAIVRPRAVMVLANDTEAVRSHPMFPEEITVLRV